ncbi:MAG: pyrroline-5-carboxylate reductase, partial [Phycisphaerales bacterium]|nr:pyrroline-5-carboxylate reductase [Phycisphaerales bacterium]
TTTTELAIIGAGNMAEAIARGILRAKLLTPDQLVAADVSADRRAVFAGQLGVRAVESNAEAVRGAKRVLLSTKPQTMRAALDGLADALPQDAVLISIAAGISSTFIEQALGRGVNWRVIRTMPNTPMLVGQGVVGLSRGTHASAADAADARRLFEAAASVIEVPEDQLHAVTAVSGSGPAYFFLLVEQMVKAGVELGLSPAHARELAARTALGAGAMLTGSTDDPAELRRKVTSPNGTTHAAIVHMEQAGVPAAIAEAVKAADRRSRELGV